MAAGGLYGQSVFTFRELNSTSLEISDNGDTGAGSAVLGVENGWFDGDRKLVREALEIVVGRAKANRRNLDFTLRLVATLIRGIRITVG